MAASHEQRRTIQDLREARPGACSIDREFGPLDTVLVTGATGYIGSLVAEALLRTTAARVVVLVRSRAGLAPADRLAKLKNGPVFRLLREEQPARLTGFEAVEGDILQDGLGLAPHDRARLQREVTCILHSAACIDLEVDIQKTLAANYEGTRQVLELARGCSQLRAMVHISSAYVNYNHPEGATIYERLYQLRYGDQTIDPMALAQELLALDNVSANERAALMCARWKFPYTYTLGKFMTEHLVNHYHQVHGLPLAVVRPSFVGSVGGKPCPGYMGNLAGYQGAVAAHAMGFINDIDAWAIKPMNIYDVVPGDVVANVVIATAAAVSAGAADAILAHASRLSDGKSGAAEPFESWQQVKPELAERAAAGQLQRPMLIVHATTGSTYPLTNCEAFNMSAEWLELCPPKFSISTRLPGRMAADYQPDQAKVKRHQRWTSFKIKAACKLLRLLGKPREAARLSAGWTAFCIINKTEIDTGPIFTSYQLLALEAAVDRSDLHTFLLVWRPTASVVVNSCQPNTAAAGSSADTAASSDQQAGSSSGASCSSSPRSSLEPDAKVTARPTSDAGCVILDKTGGKVGAQAGAGAARYYTHDGLPQPYEVSWNAWALPFFVGVYQKLYRVDVSQSKAAHKLRARIDSDLT